MALQQKDFTGKYTSGTGVVYTYILRVIENSVSTLDNSSNVTVKAILEDNYGISFSNWGTGVSCTLNGAKVFEEYKQRQYQGPRKNEFYEWSGNVAHNADGELRLKVGGELWQNSPANWSPARITIEESDSVYLDLTQIKVESTIGATDAYIGKSTTISVNRRNSDLTHSVKLQFGNIEKYINSDWELQDTEEKLTATSIAFNIPESFYEEIPKAASGECKLTITTYNGGTQVGESKTAKFTAMANPAVCAPVVVGTVEDVNGVTLALTGNSSRIVRYMSTARCQFKDTSAKYYADIEKRQVNGVVVGEEGVLDIKNAKDTNFTFTVTDSRGFSSTYTPDGLELVKYSYPTVQAVCKRTSPTSNEAKLKVTGEGFYGDFGSLDNEMYCKVTINGKLWNPNQGDLTVALGEDGKYEEEYDITNVDYEEAYEIGITVWDNTGYSVTKTIQLQKGIPVFDWGESDFRFNVPVFSQEINGTYMVSHSVDGDTVQLSLESGNSVNVLFFGISGTLLTEYTLFCGVLSADASGGAVWSGTAGISAADDDDTQKISLTFPIAGVRFTAISAGQISFD